VEQSQGVAQVGEAVTQMDQATQQNAALVEESAAAAGSLSTQADDMVKAVAFFRLGASGGGAALAGARSPRRIAPERAAPVPQRPPGNGGSGAPRPMIRAPQAAKAPPAGAGKAPRAMAESNDDWESF
jgi:hypothetical protein